MAWTPIRRRGSPAELLHIRRKDWLFILMEEGARALLWFHPLVWVLLDRIGLTREQAVDREVIRITRRRRAYLEALLRLCHAGPEPAGAPALTFLRRSHLLKRALLLTQETDMRQSRLILSLGVALAALAFTAGLGVALFPLLHSQDAVAATTPTPPEADAKAGTAKEKAEDGKPDSVPLPKLLNKVAPQFPEEAKKEGKTGEVTAQILISETGAVEEVKILKSESEVFDKAVIEALRQWKYEPPMKGGKPVREWYTITVKFKLH